MDNGNVKQINDDVNEVVKALLTENAKPPIAAIGRLLGGYLIDVHATRKATIELLTVQKEILVIKQRE